MSTYNSEPITQFPVGTQVKSTDVYVSTDTTDQTESPSGTTKKYTITKLQNYLQSTLTTLPPCKVACISELTSIVYNNGASGVGATITNNGAKAALVIDTITLSVNDVVLVQYQSSGFQNGIYVVTNTGSATTNWVLTRSIYYDGSFTNQIEQGDVVNVVLGSVNELTFWFQTAAGPFVVGVTSIVFAPQVEKQTWSTVISTPNNLVANTGYIANTTSPTVCVFLLPTTANVGDEFQIQGQGTGLFQIQQNAGQKIYFGNKSTTSGVGGSMSSSHARDGITLLCTAQDVEFTITSSLGNSFTIV